MSFFKLAKNKMIHGQRYIMLYFVSKYIPIILATEYPRSGGTWFCELLSYLLNMYFPTHKFQKIKPGIYHGHYLPSKLMKNIDKKFLIIRDGRDVMISNYFKRLTYKKNGDYTRDVKFYRNLCQFKNFNNARQNIAEFLEIMFTFKPPKTYRLTYERDWAAFNRAWLDDKVDKIVRYEDLLTDTKKTISDIIRQFFPEKFDESRIEKAIRKYSFEAKAGRKRGVSDNTSFIRKGISGDYKNYFTKEAAEIFDFYAGDLLIKLGYEKDRSWIDNFDPY